MSDPLGRTEATGVSLTELLDSYDEQCARSRAIVAARGLDELEAWAPEGMELVSLHWIMCHVIEETARHLGHLDAIRELVDGMTGLSADVEAVQAANLSETQSFESRHTQIQSDSSQSTERLGYMRDAAAIRTRRETVVCYIVVDGRLLVFRQLDHSPEEVGIQVPAGGVEPGEDPVDAAVREAREETGLEGLRVIRNLGTADYDMTPYRDEIQQRHFFELTVNGEVPERWNSAESSGGKAIRFECFWIPLADGHVLQSGQGALLGQI